MITQEQGQALADELGLKYVETSAKANTQVEEAFFNLARDVKARLIDTATNSNTNATNASTSGATGSVDVTGAGQGQKTGGCCA